jgi:hypothetical protein
MIALSFGSPATDKWLMPVILGTLASIFLAGFGVSHIIHNQRKQANDGSTSEEVDGHDLRTAGRS